MIYSSQKLALDPKEVPVGIFVKTFLLGTFAGIAALSVPGSTVGAAVPSALETLPTSQLLLKEQPKVTPDIIDIPSECMDIAMQTAWQFINSQLTGNPSPAQMQVITYNNATLFGLCLAKYN